MKRIVVVSAVFALAACSTGLMHQVSIPDASSDMRQLDTAAQSRCTSFGYQPGSPDFNRCVYGLKSQVLQSAMVPVWPVPDVRPPPPAPQQQIQTRCYESGAVTNCTTY